jgi:glutamate formiminotransferase/formiminotetrahydrofolate cyclodeaminase
MANSLVECIPNFSEARRPEIISKIINTIISIDGIRLLDKHSDIDHNRTVVTFMGEPSQVEEAAFQAIKIAALLIDLNTHTGEHPRIGATDVVPFVPIRNITMPECVEMAKRLGKRVADELQIPIYLYEEAALIPERQNLENIRRGQYEGLKKDIQINSARKPDFGPSQLGSAGATVIGARQPLIAFNVYLSTDDVKIAQKIAKTVRHSSGGFRFVKAMGILVDGRAQVSMNLTNFHQTPVARVVEAIRIEAAHYGVTIHHSELVGMTPQEALVDAATWYLQLHDFLPDQILEQKLSGAIEEKKEKSSDTTFLDDLASATPAPGGGSAAAHTGAVAASLVAMVCRLTIGKKKYAEVEPEMQALLEKAETYRTSLNQAVEQDAEAFRQFMLVGKLPKDTPEQRSVFETKIGDASIKAAQVPLEVARSALFVQEMAVMAAQKGNVNAISDAGTAVTLANAAITAAGYNVRINLINLQNNPVAASYLQEIFTIEKKSKDLKFQLAGIFKLRSNMDIEKQ